MFKRKEDMTWLNLWKQSKDMQLTATFGKSDSVKQRNGKDMSGKAQAENIFETL
jgi:hypothetical protein